LTTNRQGSVHRGRINKTAPATKCKMMSNPTRGAAAAEVVLREFSLEAAGRKLLEKTSAVFPAGEVSLIVGASGVGKSLLLRALAGLIDDGAEAVRWNGEAVVGGQPVRRGAPTRSVSVVFQSFALFDELSPIENLRFARAHGARRSHFEEYDALAPRSLLREMHAPAYTPTSSLSGGQKQRVAIARALVYDPQVILYDEPTSGLDAVTARRVAELIRHTHSVHPKTSIVVTHDHQSLSAIADRIYLFDASSRSLREVPKEDWARLNELIVLPAHDDDARDRSFVRGLRPALIGVGAKIANFFAATSRVAETAAALPIRLLPLWKSPYWGLRFLAHYLRLNAGPSAWLYLAIAGAIAGYVTTYFSFRFLPYAQVTRPLLTEELLTSIGFALYRVLVPILATILIAARSGAASASDIGGKTYGRQIDAMRTLGAAPKPYLLTNVLWSFLLGSPLLVAIAYFSAAAASVAVFTATHADRGPWFWRLHFHKALVRPDEFFYVGTLWLVAKTLVCAAGIAMIAYHIGARPKNSPTDVSRGITATILWATLYVLLVHFAFAFFEFERLQQ
jgi:ABC-type transporter Mla maintaining outer membrane lipid asymmetry ATPase subunit MlaF/ABC-type transporter Mla maintaining outer membrane lipid asymmetry permease subunit MlaE